MDTLIEIDPAALKPGTLESLIEAFVLREGTDYGSNEASFESKIKAVHTQIKNGKVKIVFDAESESCTLLSEREMRATDFTKKDPLPERQTNSNKGSL